MVGEDSRQVAELDFHLEEEVGVEELHQPHYHLVVGLVALLHHRRRDVVGSEEILRHHHHRRHFPLEGLEALEGHHHFLLEEVDLYQDQAVHSLEDFEYLEVHYLCNHLEVD